jgi:hypothetical protein
MALAMLKAILGGERRVDNRCCFLVDNALPIGGMHPREPEARVIDPSIGRVTDDLLDLRAHERPPTLTTNFGSINC